MTKRKSKEKCSFHINYFEALKTGRVRTAQGETKA